MRSFVSLCGVAAALVAAAGCQSDKPSSTAIPAYLSSDTCSQHTDAESCAADTANGCQWYGLGLACPEGVDCPSGVCQAPDPCTAHDSPEACAADTANACAWAAIDSLCPPGADCAEGGFCYGESGGDDGCACACPAYCLPGEDCPPCACDCSGGGSTGGGGTCTCACPACEPGQPCPPCDCSCDSDPTCSGGDTCVCACPACEPGQECPPCDCACDGGSAPSGGGSSDPGTPTDPPTTTTNDPCLLYTDETTCAADTADNCSWIAIGAPCPDGQTCPGGVCQNLDLGGSGGGTDGCVCACPACEPGQECPPCACDCSGGGTGSGCLVPTQPDQPPPSP